ncbi:hypothetical protein BCT21_04865 [Vibrio sp. 10N.222.55.F9]|nr:hypothetical protein BCT21_04865 [Vibrio sp. 10N.222.55.F9]
MRNSIVLFFDRICFFLEKCILGNNIFIEPYNNRIVAHSFIIFKFIRIRANFPYECESDSLIFKKCKFYLESNNSSIDNYQLRLELPLLKIGFTYNFFISDLKDDYLSTNQIKHAMGAINDVLYTNSLEAFEYNYKRGHRFFEVDIELIDNHLVLFHRSKDYSGNSWLDDIHNTRINDFKSFRYNGIYTPLTFSDLMEIVKKFQDVSFILDIKISHSKGMPHTFKNKLFSLLFTINGSVSTQLSKVETIGNYYADEMYNTKAIIDALEENIDKVYINRFLLQVNNYNSRHGLKVFKRFIWRDSASSIRDDMENINNLRLSNYSINYERRSNVDIVSGVDFYFYNVKEVIFKGKRFLD